MGLWWWVIPGREKLMDIPCCSQCGALFSGSLVGFLHVVMAVDDPLSNAIW